MRRPHRRYPIVRLLEVHVRSPHREEWLGPRLGRSGMCSKLARAKSLAPDDPSPRATTRPRLGRWRILKLSPEMFAAHVFARPSKCTAAKRDRNPYRAIPGRTLSVIPLMANCRQLSLTKSCWLRNPVRRWAPNGMRLQIQIRPNVIRRILSELRQIPRLLEWIPPRVQRAIRHFPIVMLHPLLPRI